MDWSKIISNYFAYSFVRIVCGFLIALLSAVVLLLVSHLTKNHKAKK